MDFRLSRSIHNSRANSLKAAVALILSEIRQCPPTARRSEPLSGRREARSGPTRRQQSRAGLPGWVRPVRRARWTARMAIAVLDGDRGHPAQPVFRRVGPFARDLRPKNGSRLAFVACTSLGRNPRRSCGDHACADRRSLGRSRLCAHAHRRAVPSWPFD